MIEIMALKNRDSPSWHLKYMMDFILVQLEEFSKYTIAHCFRESNVMAEFLANKAINENLPP